MTEAATQWLGENDFSAFRAAGCQSRTPMRRLLAVTVGAHGPFIHIDFQANAFLHHMVRNLVGALVEIGNARRSVRWAGELLEGRDRTLGAVTAPPQGLTLARVAYAPAFDLPQGTTADADGGFSL